MSASGYPGFELLLLGIISRNGWVVGEKRERVEGRAARDGPQCSMMECKGHGGKKGR